MPVDRLAAEFDLVVIDYPFAGFAFARDVFVNLFDVMDRQALDEIANNAIGPAFS